MIRLSLLIVVILILSGCNTPLSIVMPGTDGINRITIRGDEDPKNLIRQATITAKQYCKTAEKKFRILGSESFDTDALKQQQIYNENLQRFPTPNESYLEFICS